jgi:hypothetical protein
MTPRIQQFIAALDALQGVEENDQLPADLRQITALIEREGNIQDAIPPNFLHLRNLS